MQLNDLFDLPGARQNKKRVGRGIGSGKGKTCGRGVKGQKARAGVSINGFEGGQMPLIARLPKRGFSCPSTVKYVAFNFTDIEMLLLSEKITPGQLIDKDVLIAAGVIKNSRTKVKLLARGDLKEKFSFKLDGYSAAARQAIEAIGANIV